MKTEPEVKAITPLLNVRDVETSLRFYTEGLGFEVTQSAPVEGRAEWVRLRNRGVELMLNTSENAAKEQGAAERRRARASFTDTVLYFTVADAESTWERLKSLGFAVSEPFNAEYGMREFHARDLDGYELAVISPLSK